jgi:dihydroorotate dehydrogenase electron transfer subunit
LEAPDIASKAQPGQFVQIRTSDTYFPLWPRPFSIYDANPLSGKFSILFKVFGGGTSLMAARASGQMIHSLGPLGNSFPIPAPGMKIIMAAGGVGMPPLYFLSKRAIEQGANPKDIVFVAGAKTKADLLDEKGLYKLGVELVTCTDDGSAGARGNVVEVLSGLLTDKIKPMIYACGPNAMLKGVDSLISQYKLAGYLSLEALMPCGYGICSGCAVKVFPLAGRGPTDDNRDYHLKRVCIEGPIFGAGEVMWDG